MRSRSQYVFFADNGRTGERKLYRQNSSIFRFFFIIPVSRMLFFVVALLAPHCWLQESRRPKPQTLRLPRNPAGLNPKP